MIKMVVLGWVAGFIEGEGSFGFRSGNVRITVVQKQREPLEKLQQIFGGKIYWAREGLYQWYIGGQKAAEIAMTLYTLMSPRRKIQIERMLEPWKKQKLNAWTRIRRIQEVQTQASGRIG